MKIKICVIFILILPRFCKVAYEDISDGDSGSLWSGNRNS